MADIPSRVWTFVLCLYALGPGVMVELVTKPLWGRARPASTTLFGGDQPFSLPTEFVDHCSRNCSFVSGEVSGATALAIALLILVVRLRNSLAPLVLNAVVVLALLLPLASALQRISAGRHFLSDTVLAMLFTLLLALGLAVALRLFPKPSRTS
jgi:lipid A 4'-phosphatase